MKKVFIGLLIAAAGTAIYFLLQKRKDPIIHNSIHKEQIIGKWKLDSLYFAKDSSNSIIPVIMMLADPDLKKYTYEFTKDGAVELWLADSLTKDSIRYEWTKEDYITWKENSMKDPDEVYKISLLNKDSLLMQSKDSVSLLFTKEK